MRVLLPLIHQRCLQLMADQSEAAVAIQKQILKCFYALIQVCRWMKLQNVFSILLCGTYQGLIKPRNISSLRPNTFVLFCVVFSSIGSHQQRNVHPMDGTCTSDRR